MYRLIKFGTTNLPIYDFSWDAGTPESVQALVRSVGGPAFDAYGTDDAPASMPYTLNYKCIALAATAAALRTTLDGLRVLRGKRLKLYRQAEDDDTQHWAWARLIQFSADNSVSDSKMIWQALTLTFQVSTGWNGAAHSEEFVLNSSPKSCAMDNDGNVAELGCVITVLADTSNITALTVAITGISEWTYDGTITAGDELVIDCGLFSILNDDADAYADFALTANHHILEWLRLEPGTNTVVVTLTGGGTASTIRFEYADAWA